MPKIMKISALRNYSEILDEVKHGEPIYLTKNGEGRYAILDIEEYESLKKGLWQRNRKNPTNISHERRLYSSSV